MGAIAIRDGRPEEIHHLAVLAQASTPGDVVAAGGAIESGRLEGELGTDRLFVAECDGRVAGYAAVAIGGPLLCFAYASGLALLVAGQPWRQRLAPLGAAGRMALTNYLLQSLVCTTLFYGYGVGLLGRLGAAAGLALALALWAAQLGLSVLWLRHFRYGPAEWLWRSLTYLRAQPMRRGQAGALAAHTAGRPSAP